MHNCPISSAHYVNTMGKRIKKSIYYTSNGIIEIPLDVYVPEKFAPTLEVADSRAASGSAALTLSGLPADYDAWYSVDGLAVQVLGDRLTFADAQKGRYTLDITDAAPLEGKESCSMESTSTGYLPLTFTYSSAVNINTVDTAGLQRSIQEAADQAAKQLDAAVRALVKARPKTGTVITYSNVKYQVINSSAVRAQKAKNTSVTIDGYKYRVTAIADKAFANCRKLKTVQIQANVTSISE